MPNTLKPETALLEYKLEAFEKHQEVTDKRVKALEDERNKALIWGIIALGGAFLGLASWVFNFFTGHLK
jgi:hypothetical protein